MVGEVSRPETLEVIMPGLVTTLCLVGAFLTVVVPVVAALLARR